MEFTSVPKLQIGIESEAGALVFTESSVFVSSYASDDRPIKGIVGVHRIGTGDPLDEGVWSLREIKDGHVAKIVDGLRILQVVFDGAKFTACLSAVQQASGKVFDLYRSITNEHNVRLLVLPAKSAVPYPLDVQLSYRLKQTAIRQTEDRKPPL
jgi:hypothetical protein